jgi:hypothetical protein
MKYNQTRNFLLFICFLVIGYTASAHLYTPNHAGAASAFGTMYSSQANELQSLKNGQRTILLIGIDSKDTLKPKLQSLWLLSYLPSSSTLAFLPIYPSGNPIPSETTRRIVDSFSLERVFDIQGKAFRLVPGAGFTKELEQSNYWWSGYFILDQSGKDKILNLLGFKMDGEQGTQNQAEPGQTLKNGAEDDSFSSQLMLLQSACRQAMKFAEEPAFIDLLAQISTYLVSNIDTAQLLQEWDLISSNGEHLFCSFPTLQVSRIDR